MFDLDGTLLDARARQVETVVRACAALGAPLPDAERFWNLKRSGSTTAEALETLGMPPPLARDIAAWWLQHVEDPGMLQLDRLLPGAGAAVEACRARGCSPRLLTARRDVEAVRAQLKAQALDRLFDDCAVVYPGRAAAGKAERLKEWRAAALIGDTESDAQAAAAADVRFMAVSCGQRSESFLRSRELEVFADAHSAIRHWLALGSA